MSAMATAMSATATAMCGTCGMTTAMTNARMTGGMNRVSGGARDHGGLHAHHANDASHSRRPNQFRALGTNRTNTSPGRSNHRRTNSNYDHPK